MERRLFLTGLLGLAGAGAIATALPRQASALPIGPLEDTTPAQGGILPQVQAAEEVEGAKGVQVAQRHGPPHRGYGPPRHRRRRRIRRFRRSCRRYVNRWGHVVRRCRQIPFFVWL